MKKRHSLNLLLLLLLSTVFTGCSAIADIFEAGVWTGLIVVVIITLVIIFIARIFKR